MLISFLCFKLAEVLGAELPSSPDYDTFIVLARGIQLKFPDPADQRAVIAGMLRDALPAWMLHAYRFVSPPSKFSAELNAVMCAILSDWLVGPSTVTTAEVPVAGGGTEVWRAAVKVERCRYLEASRCKGACMNLCKVPTETFFREELGMPLTLVPDFDDLSCTFTFGVEPAPLAEDPLVVEPCYYQCPASSAAYARSGRACHTMPELPPSAGDAADA
ncbi:hypothetical protein JKP88DRAFT_206773 [Tribonema minus]|uniref:Beta-carotene isomerase D27-like C-terminal domain-containing protein n=1 Tax=Tribonema minus TaxID=303371 RepID=A0A835ZB75_9STRA|nr:hypothetical protein JKP88DRAFT_206773 [Tribonema minus]